MKQMSIPDVSVFIAYFIVVVGIGFWAGRKKKESARDFFITTGTLSWYVVGLSMIGASISTEQLVGMVGYAYSHGLAVANWEWLNFVAYSMLLWIFLPIYLRSRLITMPEFLELRYGGRTRILFAVISVLSYVFINLAGVIFSGGFLLNQMLGINLYLAFWGLAVISGAYVIFGGMASVAWTQVFQSTLLIGGGLLTFFLGLAKVPGGFSAIIGEGARAHLVLPATDPNLPWTAMVVLALSTNPWYFCTNQYINQTCLGAKNEWHAKMGVIFACALGIFTSVAYVFPGLVAYALDPNLAEGDQALPFLIQNVIPSGLRGLVFAGLVGAIMSTIQALINSSSTIVTIDIYKKSYRPEASEDEVIRFGRIFGGLVLVIGCAWAPVVLSFGTIFSYFQECWFFIAAPIIVIFLLAVLWKNATETAALWTLGLRFPLFVLPYGLRVLGVQTNPFNIAGAVFVFSLIFMIALSLVTRPHPVERIEQTLWKSSMTRLPEEVLSQGYPWYRYLSLWWIAVVSVFVGLYIVYW